MALTPDEIEVFKLFGERAGVEIYRRSSRPRFENVKKRCE